MRLANVHNKIDLETSTQNRNITIQNKKTNALFMESQNIKPRVHQDEHIVENVELNIWDAFIPVFALVGMLAYNIYVYGDDALSGSNQFILLLGASVAAIVGFFNKVSYKQMLEEVAENVKSTTGAILILLMVGALAGTWLISGIIPSLIYYGLQMLNPSILLPATVLISSFISGNSHCAESCGIIIDCCWYCYNQSEHIVNHASMIIQSRRFIQYRVFADDSAAA